MTPIEGVALVVTIFVLVPLAAILMEMAIRVPHDRRRHRRNRRQMQFNRERDW